MWLCDRESALTTKSHGFDSRSRACTGLQVNPRPPGVCGSILLPDVHFTLLSSQLNLPWPPFIYSNLNLYCPSTPSPLNLPHFPWLHSILSSSLLYNWLMYYIYGLLHFSSNWNISSSTAGIFVLFLDDPQEPWIAYSIESPPCSQSKVCWINVEWMKYYSYYHVNTGFQCGKYLGNYCSG